MLRPDRQVLQPRRLWQALRGQGSGSKWAFVKEQRPFPESGTLITLFKASNAANEGDVHDSLQQPVFRMKNRSSP